MVENIDFYEVEREGNEITLKFTDLFGDGELYRLPLDDARKLRDAITHLLRMK